MTSSFTFHAHVSAKAIEKVGRLFNASIDDILDELLQNARRAGATKVVIDQVTDTSLGAAVRLADDGEGLTDPRSFFSLGHSDWSATLSQSEDAAGMGFFALANRGATVVAQQKDTARSWTIEADPDAFHGKRPVTVAPGPDGHTGVALTFPADSNENVAAAVRRAARYFPLPVIFNGEEMPSSDFLDGADHLEVWRGIRIGVFPGDSRHSENANFHGVTLRVPLPMLSQRWQRSFAAKIDVVDCAHLKLVLPARKEVVRDAMYEALVEEIDRIYFRLIAASGPHSLSFEDYGRARTLGIELDEAEPRLRPFSPSCGDSDRSEIVAPTPVAGDALLFEGDDPLEEQNVARAIARATDMPAMFEPNHAYTGYGWYDRLHQVVVKSYRMAIGVTVEEIDPYDSFEREGRPDLLEINLEIGNRVAAHNKLLETDLIVSGPDYASLDDVDIRVSRQSTITPDELTTFLVDALFSPSDDVEAGSYSQQVEWFENEAEDLSIRLLQSTEAADMNAIVRVIQRELMWRLPKPGNCLIRIHDGKVEVEGLFPVGERAGPPRADPADTTGA